MEYKMRRKDRELSREETEKILREGEYGILSTYGKDGSPYGVPLSYVYQDGKIYFHGAGCGHKVENYNFCRRVSFCVVGKTHVLQNVFSTNYESAIAFGSIGEVTEEKEKMQALRSIVDKYAPENSANGYHYAERAFDKVHVYRMDVETKTGKSRR